MDGCVLLTSTPSCVVSPRGDPEARRGETTHSGVDVNNTHPSMINPLTQSSRMLTCQSHDPFYVSLSVAGNNVNMLAVITGRNDHWLYEHSANLVLAYLNRLLYLLYKFVFGDSIWCIKISMCLTF